jgi:hypothetical protein
MKTIKIVLVGSHGEALDTVDVEVKDCDSCSREVMAAIVREKWVLSVGDRIELHD